MPLPEPPRKPTDARAFVLASTLPVRPAFTPEIELRLATELTPIWQATEAHLAETGIEPPFWAFAWPGSLAIARHLLDHPDLVRGRRVLDFAAGCGLAAIAAARAGAASVDASELDPLAIAAIALNAEANAVRVAPRLADLTAPRPDQPDAPDPGPDPAWDLILCGDVCYAAPMTGRILPWLRARARAGCEVWLADPGRAYLPRDGLNPFGPVYDVPTTTELEDRETRPTTLYRLTA